MPKPDFIIAGFQKCGTTAIRHFLKQNYPDIVHIPFCEAEECANDSELNFFQDNSKVYNELGEEWYYSVFKDGYINGEKSPNYSIKPLYSAKLMSNICPQVKLIFTMRNPVDRAYSAYNHYLQEYPTSKNWGWDKELSFIENFDIVGTSGYRSSFKFLGIYAPKIYCYLKYFNFNQMLFVIQERLCNPETFTSEMNKITDFLELPRRDIPFTNKIHKRKYQHKPLTKEERQYMYKSYKGHNRNLFQLIEFSVPEWDEEKD